MPDLNSLLAGKASLLKIIERYNSKLEMAHRELAQINIALEILQKYGIAPENVEFKTEPKTVADMAIEILKEYPNGLTANEILENIHLRWMPNLMRSSLSPPLSRLKQLGLVKLEDQLWKLNTYTPLNPLARSQESLFERITGTVQSHLDNQTAETEEDNLIYSSNYSNYRRSRKVANSF